MPRPKRHRRLPKGEITAFIDEYQRGGTTIKDLAANFGIHRTTAAAHLDRAGITQRRKALTPTQVEEATRLYASGWSLAQIGRHLDVYPTSVYYRLRQAGVPLRPRPGRR